MSATASQGKLKREIADLIGANPDRYADELGVERHKRLTADEVRGIARMFGMGLDDEAAQQVRDAIMIRLGRDHRTGVRGWDSADLRAIIDALQEVSDRGE